MAKRTVRTNYDTDQMLLTLSILSPETKHDEEGNELEPEVLYTDEYSFDDLPQEMQTKTALFGLHQLLVQRSGPTGSTSEEKRANMQDVFQQLVEGQWSARSGGGMGSSIPLYARALAVVKDVPESVAYNTWKGLTDQQKEGLKANAKIQAAAEEIKSGGQKAQVSIDDLLAA